MRLKKLLAVILTLVICVSFMPLTASAVNAAESTSGSSAGTYKGTLPTLPSARTAIAQTAINLAYPYGTAKSKYSFYGGSARDNFTTALNKVFPDRSRWGKKPKAGASCDVFVGTAIRYSGYDMSAPRGCDSAFTYYKKHPEKWTDTGVCRVKDMQSGDVIVWKRASGTRHTCIFVRINGVGYLAEAHYNSSKFGCVDKVAHDYDPSKYTIFNVYRANKYFKGSIDKGCYGDNVVYLQNFLNWAGYDCGTADGSFGSKTVKALKAWQEDAGLVADGRFGKKSLAAAKTFVRTKSSVSTASTASSGKYYRTYRWHFPAVPEKGLKKGSKGLQVKRMQWFLNWYGVKCKVDGSFGSGTERAVKKFQTKEHLKVDGNFGKASLKRAKTIKKYY